METMPPQERLLLSGFAQLQILEAVVNAMVITHPAKSELLAEVERQIAGVRASAGWNMARVGGNEFLAERIDKTAGNWLAFVRNHAAD